MKKNVLILGSSGMLGHVVFDYLMSLQQSYVIFDVSRRIKRSNKTILLDVTDSEGLGQLMRKIKPDYIINCVGALKRQCAHSSVDAIKLNALLPSMLEDLCLENDARLIHISTDCVYDGQRGHYSENSPKLAQDVYGLSKNLGETRSSNNLTLRTSIIGPELKVDTQGLFDWFYHEEFPKGYTESIWGGVTTLELAKHIERSMRLELKGHYNVTNGVPISKYDLLILINKIWFDSSKEIIETRGDVCNRSLSSVKSVFDVKGYSEMLLELKDWMIKRSSIYPRYF